MSEYSLTLTNKWINYLVNQPETGMGYQLVEVYLKNGTILKNRKVLNSEFLILENGDQFDIEDIFNIVLEHR